MARMEAADTGVVQVVWSALIPTWGQDRVAEPAEGVPLAAVAAAEVVHLVGGESRGMGIVRPSSYAMAIDVDDSYRVRVALLNSNT